MDEMELQGAGLAFQLASQLVFFEPDAARIAQYVEDDLFDGVPFGETDQAVLDGAALLQSWCAARKGEGPEQLAETVKDLQSEWFMLLIGPSIPKAPCWAGYYLDLKSQLLSSYTVKIRKMYRAFGLEPDGVNKEPDDNLGIMLGFLAKLIAIELNAPDRAQASRDMQKQLLEEMILPWVNAWRWLVAKYAKSDFYRGVGELAFGLCRAYAVRFGDEFVEDGQNSRFVSKDV